MNHKPKRAHGPKPGSHCRRGHDYSQPGVALLNSRTGVREGCRACRALLFPNIEDLNNGWENTLVRLQARAIGWAAWVNGKRDEHVDLERVE